MPSQRVHRDSDGVGNHLAVLGHRPYQNVGDGSHLRRGRKREGSHGADAGGRHWFAAAIHHHPFAYHLQQEGFLMSEDHAQQQFADSVFNVEDNS